MPMALLVGLAAHERVTPDGLTIAVTLTEGLKDPVMLPVRDALAEPVSEAERHRVPEVEGDGDTELATLCVRDTDTVTEADGELEGTGVGVEEAEEQRDTLTERVRLRVGQLVAVVEEERHSVGLCEGLGDTEVEGLSLELIE